MTLVAVTVIVVSSLFLFAYGSNLLYLSLRALRLPPGVEPPPVTRDEPEVAVQLPIYNERYVAQRVIDAVARLDWPREKLEIQVLDDSNDETVGIVAERVRRWRAEGIRITHLRRRSREGYKAGALAFGLEQTEADLIAIFDADFLPAPDFLRRAVGGLADPQVGFVQARWEHLNRRYSIFTRLQSLMIDFHFRVEQAVRPRAGYLTNFTGTAGIWRRAAIEDAGGWSADTLTEDLDLSYRAQLKGWRAAFIEGLSVPQELPVAVNGYRGQQSRWATGSFQTALKLLPAVMRSGLPAAHKFQAAMHLLAYLAPALMLVQLACYPLLLWAKVGHDPLFGLIRVPILVNLLSLAPAIGSSVAQWRAGGAWWRRLPGILAWSFVGAGTSATVIAALLRAFRRGGVFNRTPKYRIEAEGEEWRDHAYVRAGDPAALAELLLGSATLGLGVAAAALGEWLMAVYAAIFSCGFLYLSGYSALQAVEVLTVRRLGLGTLAGLRRSLPLLPLLAAPGALLVALAQWQDPFEDSFQHWLMAANLVQTGHLGDPLFGMEDTWLPGYQYLAAAVLQVAGWHQMEALKLANVVLAMLTLVLVNQLAETPRQGRLAVLLLALNPIFLLTSTSAVAEPLLLVTLTGAALALSRRMPALAAALAVLACLAGTKAWLWLFCVLAAVAGELLLRRRRPALRPALAWALPAVAVLLVLQLTGGQATHSVARAAQEASSAVARGDLTADPLARGVSFVGYFLLASLPMVILAPLGLRSQLQASSGLRLRLLVLPAALFLGVVTLLVFAGVYSGSHRYYYLALPGLALLAASGLDRHPRPLGVLAAAAAGLVTVAYLPLLAGLASADRGLVAAGRAAAAQPGALLTDSPVAAYYSGKEPSQIFGSRLLPADATAATGWLQDHGVGSAVVEDIPYYRVSAVYPGLAQGQPIAPFEPVGRQADFTVAGGKGTHVYRVPPERLCAWVTGTVLADLNPADEPAVGKSAGLAKGLRLETMNGKPVTGEGLGFGAPLARYSDGDYFSGTATTTDLSRPGATTWVKVFELDRVGVDSDRRFLPAPSRGRVVVTYRVASGRIDISVAADLQPGFQQLVIFNEQSAAFDDFADPTQTRLGGAIGSWRPVEGGWGRFRSGLLDMEWSQPALAGADLHAGREVRAPDIDFSGLEYVFGPGFQGADYQVAVSKAR